MSKGMMQKRIRYIQKLSADDLLAALGLQRRVSPETIILSSAGMFALGAVAGATAAVLLTPKSGPVMRRQLSSGAKDLSQRLGTTANSVVNELRGAPTKGNTVSGDAAHPDMSPHPGQPAGSA